MAKVAQKIGLIFFLISSILFSTVYLANPPENHDSDNRLKLSGSDSWAKVVKNGERWSNLELYNNSLYVFGYSGHVSKFDTSGTLLWEYPTNLDRPNPPFHVFDSDGNLLILFEKPSQDELSLIKLSSSGILLYSKDIRVKDYCHETSITLSENNSIIVTSYSYNLNKLLLTKLNSNGKLLWNKSFFASPYSKYPFIVSDSHYNLYIPYYENYSNFYIAKINGSGDLLWQIEIGDFPPIESFMIDANDTLFLIESSFGKTRIFKIDSSGFILKELVIYDFTTDYNNRCFDDMLLIPRSDLSILYCYDLNLNFNWNFNLSDYVVPRFYLLIDLARDSQGNIYILQTNYFGDISLLKINSTGKFVSQILWGGPNNEFLRNLIVDSENNIYFMCYCEYLAPWSKYREYTIIVKNPIDGGSPPKPEIDLNLFDYFLFSVVGIACIISPVALFSILKNKKKRFG
jgi:hypothetical protein